MINETTGIKTVTTSIIKRDDGVTHSQHLVTVNDAAPNVIFAAMSATYAVLVRTARVYAQTFMGLLTAQFGAVDAVLGAGVTPQDFLGKVQVAAALALAPALFTLVQNAAELIMRLDEKLPRFRA